jgi:acetyl-CoA carboxylase carboxyl transferase subunit beta
VYVVSKIRDIFRSKPKYVTVKPIAQGKQEPKAKAQVPDNTWVKCPQCSVTLYRKDLERNLQVCEKCDYHYPVDARARIQQLIEPHYPFEEFDADVSQVDPLNFPSYAEKRERDTAKTGLTEGVLTGKGVIGRYPVVLGVLDFGFMGGSMGSVVGEKITRAFEHATEAKLPVVLVSSSGGARMQEAIISLMQMQKTAAAVEAHSRAGLLYVSVLANPTMAGVYGSFASQGDVNIAEPGATVGFAGRGVIEAAIGKSVPANLQKAETVYANGFIDMIVPRRQLKETLEKLLALHSDGTNVVEPVALDEAPTLEHPIVLETAVAAESSAPPAKSKRAGRKPAVETPSVPVEGAADADDSAKPAKKSRGSKKTKAEPMAAPDKSEAEPVAPRRGGLHRRRAT